MSYQPQSGGSLLRMPSYVSPFSDMTPGSAPGTGTYAAQNSLYAYPITVSTSTVVERVWAALGPGIDVRAVAYSGSLWVAVGASGFVATSSDGLTWTRGTSGVTSQLNGVAYGGTTWVMVGATGVVRTSSDGLTWAAASSPGFSTNNVWAVTYSGGTWVAVGANGTVRYAATPSGTWTAATSPGFSTNIVTAVYTNGTTWVAGDAAGNIRYATDPTGTWSAATSNFGGQGVNGFASSGSTWVAVGHLGRVRYTSDPTGSWSTPASAGWTGSYSVYGVATDGTTWVVVGNGANIKYATDPSGTWTAASGPDSAGTGYFGVVYAGSKWVAVASGGGVAVSTSPTTSWPGTNNDAAQIGIYRADLSLLVSTSVTVANTNTFLLRYGDITDTLLMPGLYYIALWSPDSGWGQFYRSTGTQFRLRSRFVQTGLTSGLPSTLTLSQDTVGNVYLFGFTTR